MFKISKLLNILSIVLLIVQILGVLFYIGKVPNYIIMLDLFCVVSYCIVVSSNLILGKNLKISKKNVLMLAKHNSNLKKADEDIRAFKHDFNNIMQAVGGYLKLNDYDGLKLYYEDLISECVLLKTFTSINPNEINNNKIYNMIIEKSELAKTKNISFEFISLVDFNIFRDLDFCLEEMLENLLDIAIKQAENASKKEIIIDCINDSLTNKYIIIITSKSCLLNSNVLTNEKETINHEMNYMRKIAEKSKIVDLYINIEDEILVQQLTINLEPENKNNIKKNKIYVR